MKTKLLLILAFISISNILASAQDDINDTPLVNKKGVAILPQPGDWAVGIDATPFFKYLGNLFSTNNDNTPSFGFTADNPGYIYFKYKKSERTSYRGALLIGASMVTDKIANTADENKPHKMNYSALNIGIFGGIEKSRPIKGRLEGIYGAQGGIHLAPYNQGGTLGKVSYRDAQTSDNDYVEYGGNTYSLTVGMFAGVEYYIAPRISLSGEFGLNLYLATQTRRKIKQASNDPVTTDFGSNSIGFTTNASGDLVLHLYF